MVKLQCTSKPNSIKNWGRTLYKPPGVPNGDCLAVATTKQGSTPASFDRPVQDLAMMGENRGLDHVHAHINVTAYLPGSPVPEVSWFRDGQVISTSTLPGVQISFSDGRAKLTIPAVTKANSGRYSLRATNGSGQATSTAELLVTGRPVGISLSPARTEGVQIELHPQRRQLPSWGRIRRMTVHDCVGCAI